MTRRAWNSRVVVASALLLATVGMSIRGTRGQTKGSASVAESPSPPTSYSGRLCYEFDPKTTQLAAISDGRSYEGVPPALSRRDDLQPWSGYCPQCELEDPSACERLPCQTANIKVSGQYEGIEVGDNKWMEPIS